MGFRYNHTNITAKDAERLGAFYVDVLGCTRGPDRVLGGPWLDKGLGLPNATLAGFHLQLPGHGENGPRLEIFTFDEQEEPGEHPVNRPGIMHMAFEVDDIEATVEKLLAAGGSLSGEISYTVIDDTGTVRFVYARDPEGNVVELQQWGADPL